MDNARDLTDRQVLDHGLKELRELLGPPLKVEPLQMAPQQEARLAVGDRADMIVSISDAQMGGPMARVLVEAKGYPAPSATELTENLVLRLRLMQQLSGQADAIVVAPWLGPRARSALRGHEINYLDLTGNVSIRIQRPTIIVELSGAEHDPFADQRGTRAPQFAGPKATRLIRFLADVIPPYRAIDIAERTGLSQAYISRLLGALDDRGLITRRGRMVIDVDWVELLRDRGRQQGHLLATNSWTGWHARGGVEAILNRLRGVEAGVFITPATAPALVTGSHAARAFAPLTVGGQLMLYVPSGATKAWAEEFNLSGPSRSAPDVVLLEPPDPIVFDRAIEYEGVKIPAPSQLVLDLMTGTGRQPQEGLAVLEALEKDPGWRIPLERVPIGETMSESEDR